LGDCGEGELILRTAWGRAQIAKLTTVVVLAAIAIVLCAYAFVLAKSMTAVRWWRISRILHAALWLAVIAYYLYFWTRPKGSL
jgi:hypothetical protein